MNAQIEKINVAKKSQNGHFVVKANKVVEINATEETFNVFLKEGESAVLESKNHGDIVIDKDCTIFHQDQYNPFTELISKRLD